MAPQEQERRYQQLLAALGPGLGAGGQASAGYGQQAAQYGQQAANAYGNINNIAQQLLYSQQLAHQPQVATAPAPEDYADVTGGSSPAPWSPMGQYQTQIPWWMQPFNPYGNL